MSSEMDTKSIQVPKALSFQIFHFHKKYFAVKMLNAFLMEERVSDEQKIYWALKNSKLLPSAQQQQQYYFHQKST